MNPKQWTAVDQYITDTIVAQDNALTEALRDSAAAGLPEIHVAPNQGKLLHLFARMIGAKRILEIGTLGGYSTIWLARALPPDGKLITLEFSEKHAAVARGNMARAGLVSKIDLRLGKALDLLPHLAAEKLPPFDLVFIDADKSNNPDYFAWALKLSRIGSVIIIDNVIRSGNVIDAASADASIVGTRRTFDAIRKEPRVTATALQTVGAKGYDGFILASVIGE